MNSPDVIPIGELEGRETRLSEGEVRIDSLNKYMSERVNLSVVRESLGHLESLCHAKIEASEDFSDACKAVAEKCGIGKSVISAYVTSIAKETAEKEKLYAEQLELLFSEI